MFERDYLMKMLVDLAAAIRRSMSRAREDKDLKGSIDILNSSIGQATDLDGSVLLTLSPDSIAQVLQVSNADPRVVIYIAHSMQLQAHYLEKLNDLEMAELRRKQAFALSSAYNFSLPEHIEEVDEKMFDQDAFIESINEMCNS